MKQIRIYYKGKDILKYFFLILVPLIWIILFIGSKGLIEIRYPTFLAAIDFSLFILGYLNYAKKFPNPKNVNLTKLKTTNDMRISLFTFKGFVSNGDNFSYIKMFFDENEIYLYMRNFLIKMYEGPLVIEKNIESNDNFHISKFEIINKTEILISITNKINTRSYSFKLKNIDISVYNLIIKNISKFYKNEFEINFK